MGAGVAGTGVTIDLLGTTRGNPPSIGAYENAGDNTPPSVSYTNISNTSSTSNYALSSFATITDAGSGVNTTSGTRPRIYYKKSTDNNTFGANTSGTNGWKYAEASNSSSPFSFTIDYSIINGGSVTTSDVIQYFVIAQDLATTPNVASSPSTGLSATSVSSISSAPTSPNSFTIVGSPLSGTYTVGSGGNYATLTAAVTDVVNRGISASVVFSLTDATYSGSETFPIIVGSVNGTSPTQSVTIKPASGNSATISGSSASAILKLNGCDYITIDGSNNGSSSRDLTITNTNSSTTSAVVWVASESASNGASSNTVKNCILTGSGTTQTFAGIFMGGTTTIGVAGTAAVSNNNNTFHNNNITAALTGIVTTGNGASAPDSSTTITSNLVGSSVSAMNTGGILVYFGYANNVSGNTVQNIVGGGSVTAISGSASLHTGIYIRNCQSSTINANRISNVSCNGTGSPRTVGLASESPSFNTSGSPSSNTFSNNVIYDVYNQATGSTTWTCTGMGTYGGYGDKVYYNTVQLSHPSSGSITNSNGPFAAFANGHAVMVATTTNLDCRNNLFMARGATATTSTGHAFYTQLTSMSGATSDYNRYYLTVTGNTNNYMGRFNATNYNTLSAWQTATSTDGNSSEGDPQVNSLSNLAPLTSSPLLAAATVVSVTTDYNGTTRHASTPTIGAYEAAIDAVAPVITYTPLGSTASTANRTLTGFATITDAGTGVNTGSGSRPRIYYKKSSDADAFGANNSSTNGWKYAEASNTSSPFSFTIDVSLINGGSVSTGDTIEYFVTAQDLNSTPNVSSNPATGFVATGVNSISTAPNTPEFYTIAAALSTTLLVGTGQTYTTLTGSGGLFDAINSGVLGGNTVASVTSDLSEPGTVALDNAGLGGYTLTIQPSAAATRVISNSTDLSQAMLRFDGTIGVTIDGRSGGSGQYFRIVNTHATAASCQPAVHFMNGCSTSTVRNCIIESNISTTTLGTVLVGAGTNTNITIRNNDLRNAQGSPGTTGTPSAGIYSNNSSNQISVLDNSIYNFTTNGVLFSAVEDSCIVTGNSFYNNLGTPPSVAQTSLVIQGGSGNHTVTGNYIGGSSANCGGSAWVNSGAITFTGISLAVGSTATSVQANTIQNISLTNTGGVNFNGIQVTSGNADVGTTSGNTIGHNTTANSVSNSGSSTTSVTAGILSTTTGTLNLVNNTIANLTATGTTTSVGLRGISHIAASSLNATGNTIHSLTSSATTTSLTTAACIGIYISSAGTAHVVSQNTIRNLSNLASTANTATIGIGLNSTTSAGTVSRNRIYDLRNVSTGSPVIYGITVNTGAGWGVLNNQVTLSNGSNTNACSMIGIRDASAGAHYYIYNSVYIGGSAASGSTTSSCLTRTTTTSTPLTRNNIFYNGRTGGTGVHYAVSSTSATGITQNTQNYNLYVVADTAKIVELPSGTANGWYAFGSIYTTTPNSNITEKTSTLSASNLFADLNNGNLNINENNAESWYVNGKGMQIAGKMDDYGAAGVRSTTISGGGTDIGSDEFTPTSSNASNATQVGTHTLGGTEHFWYAGRKIATIIWDTIGTLPTISGYKYFSGKWPNDTTNNNTVTNSRYFNNYWSINATGGSGYRYNIVLYYDPALLGSVQSEASLRITKKQTGVDGSWHIQSYQTDTVANTITALGQTGFSEFTGTDSGALLPPNDPIGNNNVFSDQQVCSGSAPIELLGDAPSGGNGDYTYLWQVSTTNDSTGFSTAGGTNNGINYSPGTQTQTTWYRRVVSSAGLSDTSDAVEMTNVANVTPSVSISESADTICAGGSVTFTATPTNGGSAPTYSFRVNGTNMQTSASNTYITSGLNDDDSVWVIMTANNLCQSTATATSSKVYMTVDAAVTPSVSIAANTSVLCGNTSITYTATPVNGGSSPTYDFRVNGSSMQNGSSNTYTATLTATNVVTCVMTSSLTCVTSSTATSNALTVVICPQSSSFLNPNVWSNSSAGTTGSTNLVINTSPVTVSSTVACNNLTINAGDTLIVNSGGNITINGDFNLNGTLIMNNGSITFTKPGGRIPAATYHQLRICAAGTMHLGGNATVNNNLIICSGTTFNDSGYALTVKGNVTNDGTHASMNNGKIVMGGTVSQTIDNAGAYNSPYGNLEVTNTVLVRMGGSSTTDRNATINGTLTLTGGNLAINGNTITFSPTGNMSASGTGIIQGGGTTGSIVINGNGASTQITGLACNIKGNLTLNRSQGAKLKANSYVGSNLTLSLGGLDIDGKDLNIGTTTTSTGTISTTSGLITNSSHTAGTLNLLGSAAASTISGLKADSLYRLYVNRTAGATLGGNMYVHNLVTLAKGGIDLNGSNVTLSETASISESSGNLFSGSTGYISTTRGYSTAPSAVNIAGMGLTFTHNTATGSCSVIRGHTSHSSGSGSGIKRYYQIQVTNSGTSTFQFAYQSSELSGATHSNLRMNISTNGGSTWATLSGVTRSAAGTQAWVQKTGVSLSSSATLLTLSDSVNSPLSPLVNQLTPFVSSSESISAWPSPFNATLAVALQQAQAGNFTITLLDLSGKVVFTQTLTGAEGHNTITLNTTPLAAGMYVLQVQPANGKATQLKVMKQ